MSKLFNSLSPSLDNIAGVGNAFQRDSLDSSYKVVFEESGHGVKFSPQSKHTGVNHHVCGVSGALTVRRAVFIGFGLYALCEQPCAISDFMSCPSRVFQSESLNVS